MFISRQEPSRKKRGGYSIENLKIRPKDCPVVVFGVNFQIFILIRGVQGAKPLGRGFAASEQRDFSGYSFGHKRVPPAAASAVKDKRQLAAGLKSLQSAPADSSPCFKGSLISNPINSSPLDCHSLALLCFARPLLQGEAYLYFPLKFQYFAGCAPLSRSRRQPLHKGSLVSIFRKQFNTRGSNEHY